MEIQMTHLLSFWVNNGRALMNQHTLAAAVFLFGVAACGETSRTVQPLEIADSTACSLDGMVLKDYPGPKGQIHYEEGEPDWFCDTVEMFSVYLKPEQRKRVVAIWTQDMAKASWDQPKNNWIDAKSAFFVVGSKRKGSMGPTIASFAVQTDAAAFSQQFGGKVLRFEEVQPQMVDLTGGAAHDEKM